MKEWLIELGKVVFGLGIAKTNNGQPPQDFQYYGIGLYLFVFGCVCLGILVIIVIIYLLSRKRRNKNGEISKIRTN